MKRLLLNFYMKRSWKQTFQGERRLGEAKKSFFEKSAKQG